MCCAGLGLSWPPPPDYPGTPGHQPSSIPGPAKPRPYVNLDNNATHRPASDCSPHSNSSQPKPNSTSSSRQQKKAAHQPSVSSLDSGTKYWTATAQSKHNLRSTFGGCEGTSGTAWALSIQGSPVRWWACIFVFKVCLERTGPAGGKNTPPALDCKPLQQQQPFSNCVSTVGAPSPEYLSRTLHVVLRHRTAISNDRISSLFYLSPASSLIRTHTPASTHDDKALLATFLLSCGIATRFWILGPGLTSCRLHPTADKGSKQH